MSSFGSIEIHSIALPTLAECQLKKDKSNANAERMGSISLTEAPLLERKHLGRVCHAVELDVDGRPLRECKIDLVDAPLMVVDHVDRAVAVRAVRFAAMEAAIVVGNIDVLVDVVDDGVVRRGAARLTACDNGRRRRRLIVFQFNRHAAHR